MEAIVCGLLGAALGVGLYRLGWYTARRTPKRMEGEKTAMPTLPLTEQEWYNFLHYDGSEQEVQE